jgi:hypothetical protein
LSHLVAMLQPCVSHDPVTLLSNQWRRLMILTSFHPFSPSVFHAYKSCPIRSLSQCSFFHPFHL